MKKQLFFISILLLTFVWQSCKKESDKFMDADAPAPAQVTDLKVAANPGGAVVTYKLPIDSNLSYVKAVYEIQPGVSREAKSSYYTDSLSLVGFGDTLSHEVKIYSVGKNEKASEPVLLTIKPLVPPVRSVFSTLTLDATFGGVDVTFKNVSRANLAISVIVDSTGLGTWAPVTTYYTGAQEGNFSARGLDTLQKNFGVVVRDRWNNYSDTLIKPLSPLYETLIPSQGKFKALHLPGDFWQSVHSTDNLENIWNGITDQTEDIFNTADKITKPQWFTIDLGQTVRLSRLRLYQRISYPYAAAWLKEFEIYGSNNPDADGSWNNWQLFGHFVSNPPSGSIWPAYTAEDMDYEASGEDYSLPQPIPAVRYIRLKSLRSYANDGHYMIAELTFWGQILQ